MLASAMAAPLAFSAANAQQSAIDKDALAFAARESVANMDISPTGTKAVFTGAGPGRSTIIYIADLVAGTTKPILSSKADPESLQWCQFVSDARLACRFTAIISENGFLIPAARTISINSDGSDVKELGQRASSFDIGLRQYDGRIIDWLPGNGQEVLMTRTYLPEGFKATATNINRTKTGIGVVRVNVSTLKAAQVEPPRRMAGGFMSDGRGNVRLLALDEVKGETQLSGRTKYQYRKANGRSWEDLTDYQSDDFVPLAIDGTIDSLYALKKIDGRYSLITVKLDGSLETKVVASNPKVDIDDVVRSGDGQKVIGYRFVDEYSHVVYFDPAYQSLRTSLENALPNLPLVTFQGTSDDGTKTILFAGSDADPGRYYLFDRTKKSLAEILPVRPTLAGRTLAKVTPVQYKAADGTTIPAYLTLPAGKEAKNLPAVVLPHGGPSARDEWGFDWLSQFLAARGYAVIQPNYRGSAGFGDAWLNQNGFKQWRTSISDVAAAADYLASSGIADRNRIAIVGWSYGGYAALQSAATYPGKFKSVVAIAPVVDLQMWKEDRQDYTDFRIVSDFVGNGPHLVEGSPLKQAANISVPVLLVHGDLDVNVAVRHSLRMNDALKSAGKESDLVEFKGLDHYLEDSDARALMLSKMGTLLDRTIGH